MPLAFTFRGAVVDANVARFVEVGSNMVVDRTNMELLDEAALKKQMAAEGYTPPAWEIGKAQAWLDTHTGPWTSWIAGGAGPAQPPAVPDITQPTNLPITGDATGTQTTIIDFDWHSHDVPPGGLAATVVYNIGATDQTLTVPLAAGTAPGNATRAVATAINGVTGLGAANQGGTITVTPDDGVVLSKLTVTVAP